MLKKFMVACLLQAASTSFACAAGPYGTIHVGAWIGGAYMIRAATFRIAQP